MGKELKQNFILLKEYKHRLTRQQFKTFKGQILHGDIEGFRKGLFNVIKREVMG
jgi:hypothetical protein